MARSTYTPARAREILRKIANGESLNKVCGPNREKGWPERMTVYNWLHRYDEFKRLYLLARRAQADLYLDEVVDIADAKDDDAAAPRELARDKFRVETRRWRAATLSPHFPIDRQAMVDGGDGGPPLRSFDAREAEARIAAILDEAGSQGGEHEY